MKSLKNEIRLMPQKHGRPEFGSYFSHKSSFVKLQGRGKHTYVKVGQRILERVWLLAMASSKRGAHLVSK